MGLVVISSQTMEIFVKRPVVKKVKFAWDIRTHEKCENCREIVLEEEH
jgi:hypothetical protein